MRKRHAVVTQCCVCLKVKEGEKWVMVEKPIKVRERASHTYCPRCKKLAFGPLVNANA